MDYSKTYRIFICSFFNLIDKLNIQKMKTTVLISFSIFVVLCFLNSCHNDHNSYCDYLPLKVGAKFLYSFNGSYYEPGLGIISEKGECKWEFIDRNPTSVYVYLVRQTLNGIHVIKESTTSDTTIISNVIDTVTFKINVNGTFTITFPVMYFQPNSMTAERYLECSKTDPCFSDSYGTNICLTKNVGIKFLSYGPVGNHQSFTSYTLIKGPY